MTIRISAALACTLLALLTPGHAAEWKPIQGSFVLTAQNDLDPAPGEPVDSHIRFQLTGRAARDLFAAMKVAPTTDECTGAVAKRVGEMQCLHYKAPHRYECSFAIAVMAQKIEHGLAC